MKVPNHKTAVVPQRKITEYLLSSTHSTGKGKAGFFSRFGYTQENWQNLANDLLQHIDDNEVTKTEQSPFGIRYIVEGKFRAADERQPLVRSIWFVRHNEDIPQFVSAYPLKPKLKGNKP